MTEYETTPVVPLNRGLDDATLGPSCPAAPPGQDENLARLLADLVAAVGDGDRDAFTDLYRLTSHRVFGLAVRMLRNRSAAEEVAQEVYLQVWSLAGRYDKRMSSPMGWLMMLTHRRAVDRIRSERSAAGRDLVYGHAHADRDHDAVLEAVEQHFEERAVVRCLDTLTELQRDSIMLAYYGGHTYPEIADRLGTQVSTVKTRVRDGLRRLSACLVGREAL